MKKLLAFLLVSVLMLSLASCAVSTNNVLDNLSDDEVSTPNVSESSTPATSTYSLGVISGNQWENDFLGLGATLPDGWSFYSDEQIRQLNNLTMDLVGDELAAELEKATTIFDMFASDGATNNVNVVLQQVGILPVDMDDTLQATIDATAPGLENAGYTGVTIVKEQQTMGGKTYEGLRTTATIQGVAMYQRSVIFQQGKYLVSITATALGEDVTQTILNNFYNLA